MLVPSVGIDKNGLILIDIITDDTNTCPLYNDDNAIRTHVCMYVAEYMKCFRSLFT